MGRRSRHQDAGDGEAFPVCLHTYVRPVPLSEGMESGYYTTLALTVLGNSVALLKAQSLGEWGEGRADFELLISSFEAGFRKCRVTGVWVKVLTLNVDL